MDDKDLPAGGTPNDGLPPAPPSPDAAVEPAAPPPPPPRRGGALVGVIVGVVALVAVAVAGGVGAFLWLRGSGEQLLDMVPADTDAVVAVYLDPAASQKVNLFRLADRIPSLGSREELTGMVDDAIDGGLEAAGLTHEDLSWVGPEVAITVRFPASGSADDVAVAALVATDDESAAADTLTKLREDDPSASGWRSEDHDGVEVWVGDDAGGGQIAYALVDGVVVLSDSTDAIDDVIAASRGEVDALASSTAFDEATSDLPEGRLAMLYAAPSNFADALRDLSGTDVAAGLTAGTPSLEAVTGVALSVSAEEDGLAVDAQVTYDPDQLSPEMRAAFETPVHDNPLIDSIPADPLVLMSQEWMGATFDGIVSQLEQDAPQVAAAIDPGFVDSLTGDAALAVMSTGSAGVPSGVLMIGTDDEAAMEATIRSLADIAVPRRQRVSSTGSGAAGSTPHPVRLRWEQQEHGGVSVTTLVDPTNSTPFAFSYAIVDGAGVIGASPEAIVAVIDTAAGGASAASSTVYQDAMSAVPKGATSVYVDIDGLADAIRSQLPADQVASFDAQTGDTMDHLDAFVMGTDASGNSQHVRMFLRVV